MRSNTKNYQQNRNTRAYNNMYVYGSAAPKYDFQRQFEEPQKRGLSNEARKNREKARYMSLGYVVFLIAALVVAGAVLIGYIRLQADITTLSEAITKQEKKINSLQIENEEAWSRIERNVDLEEIKRVAIQELGMVYPEEGQIVTYENVGMDYARKVAGAD